MYSTPARFSVHEEFGTPIVDIRGDVDVSNIDAASAVLIAAEESRARAVIVVLEAAGCICVRFYSLLSAMHVRMERRGRRFCVVCGADKQPRRIMNLLEVAFPVFEAVPQARLAARRAIKRSPGASVIRGAVR